MKQEISEKIAKYKEIVTGILVIAGVVGGLYGSLKGETEARESHQSLAPMVDNATEIIIEQEIRISRLEARQELYQELFTGFILKTVDEEALFKVMGDSLVNESLPPPPPVIDKSPVKTPKRKDKEPVLDKKSRPIQQRKKTSWEQKTLD